MLRYIIGVSLVAAVIMVVRVLTDGKILNKHRYALWLLIPLYMMAAPFIRIAVPMPEELTGLFAKASEAYAYDVREDIAGDALAGDNEDEHYYGLLPESGFTNMEYYYNVNNDSAPLTKAEGRDAEDPAAVLNTVYITVTSVFAFGLLTYNAGFVLYLRRNRKYLGTDPLSGLKMYCISHKGAPFLLFDKIYVSPDREDKNGYVVCHEACHHKNGDHIWVILRYIVLVLNWYNPVIWLAFVLSGRDSELACDEEVIRVLEGASSAEYAMMLVERMGNRSDRPCTFTLSSGMRSGYKTMRRRIISIKHPAKKSYKVLVLSLAMVIFISGFSVLEPKADSGISADDLLIEEVEAPASRQAPFGYVTDIPGVTKTSAYEADITFKRDGDDIPAKLLLPRGEGPFETLIITGDTSTEYGEYESSLKRFTDNGYAVIFIENRFASEFSRRFSGSTSKLMGDLYYELILDQFAVMDELRYLSCVDGTKVFLVGDGLGGTISAYTASQRPSDVKGMVLTKPYLSEAQYMTLSEDPKVVIKIYEALEGCKVPTYIFESSWASLYSSKMAVKSMSVCELITVDEIYWEHPGNMLESNILDKLESF